MKATRQIELLAAAAACFLSSSDAALYSAPVKIKDGYVQGYRALNSTTAANLTNWQTMTAWKGIPFAADTAGANRWQPPKPPTPWNTTLLASAFGPGCPSGPGPENTAPTSEDCLSVNVWSPALTANASLPVAVWSYGAGGSSSNDNLDGAGVADKGIVFVTYNYRTGPFGWLTLPELSAENPRNISGNYGLFDQFQVLRWIKENIAAFGGNPDHVTIMGQSFGSGAVLHAINSPLVKDLFVGAIAESGIKSPYDPDLSDFGSNYITLETAYKASEEYMAALNVSTVSQLRALSTDTLLSLTDYVSNSRYFDPVLDYYAIPCTYEESLLRGPVTDVPILAGNNLDEDGVNVSATYTVAEYYPALEALYNDSFTDTFYKLYPPGNTSESATLAYNTQVRDETKISTWSFSTSWARTATSPFYAYWWTHTPTGTNGATHGSEIDYVLNTLFADDANAWADDDYAIAGVMSSYWANFIKTGNPNLGRSYETYYPGKGNLTHWPPSVVESETVFEVGTGYMVQPLATSKTKVQTILDWFHNATEPPF